MVTAAGQVEDALGTIKGLQARLNGITADLSSKWQGESATAFGNAYERFNADFQVVINALNGIHERLVGSHANYNSVEAANTTSATRISAALNR